MTPRIEMFSVRKFEPEVDTLIFWTGPGRRDPEFEIRIDPKSLESTEDGFTAHPLNSKVSVGIHFYYDTINIVLIENEAYLFSTALSIDEDAVKQFYKYANKVLRNRELEQQQKEISYLPEIQTKKGVGLVENVEGHIGSFLTGEKGTIKQQANVIRKKKNMNGGARTRKNIRHR
jgi:hypothetical protein